MYHSSKWESKSYRIAKKFLQWAHSLLKEEEVLSYCFVSICTTVLQAAAALQLAIILFHNVCGCACMFGK